MVSIRLKIRYSRSADDSVPDLDHAVLDNRHAVGIPVSRASPARVFGLVVTRQVFAGAPAIFREGGGVCPISVAGLTPKSITDGCAALHHVAILPAHRCVALALVSGNRPAFP